MNKRRQKCEIRVSTSEKEQLQKLASQLGLSVSGMVRQVLIHSPHFITQQELNHVLGQIRDSLLLISQALDTSNLPIITELKTEIQQLKERVDKIQKRF